MFVQFCASNAIVSYMDNNKSIYTAIYKCQPRFFLLCFDYMSTSPLRQSVRVKTNN